MACKYISNTMHSSHTSTYYRECHLEISHFPGHFSILIFFHFSPFVKELGQHCLSSPEKPPRKERTAMWKILPSISIWEEGEEAFFGEKWYLTKNITFLGWWHTVLNFHSCLNLKDSSLKNSPRWDSNYTTSNVTERSRVRIQGRQKLKIWIFARSENWFLNTVCGVEAFIF